MRINVLAIAAACSLLATAQEVEVTRHEQLLKGVESGVYNPVISSDGQKVLFSGIDYSGLKVYDMEDNVVSTISGDAMAGFEPAFSADGETVYFLSQTHENQRTYRATKSYSLSTKAEATVVEKARGMMPPVAVADGVVSVSDAGVAHKAASAAVAASAVVYSNGSEIVVGKGKAEARLKPVATDYTYLWVSLSPDGEKILFYAGGKGAYVCDLSGNVLASLGKYTAPRWMGNDYVVAQKTTDDGYQFESSQIVLLGADGTYLKALTSPESMSMNPSASAEGNRIVYNTIDGRLYVMELSIK